MEFGGDQRTRDDIAKFGCTVMHVMAEDELPPFAYSIGIQKATGAPEVAVIGLEQRIAHFVVNEYNRRVREGERLRPGARYSGFLEGFEVYVEAVPVSAYADYFGQAMDFYGGCAFEMLQIVYPTTKGIWPWDKDAPDSFRAWQPILSGKGRGGAP